jgi:hypothetical protein
VPGSEGNCDSCGRDDDKNPGGVGAALGVYVGTEDDRDDERAQNEDQYQGTYGPGPLGSHPVAGQVARDQVQQTRHRRRAGKPQDRNR